MNINFDCGECGSSFMVEDDMDQFSEGVWLLANRFVNAHARCKFVTNEVSDFTVSSKSASKIPLSALLNGD